MKKIAVVLFNLGGPDSPEAVRPFLFNLFNDPAIIRLPFPFRQILARMISSGRETAAQEIYAKIGGHSPILENTQAQASLLEKRLNDLGEVKCFVAMRYWHPFTEETAMAVKAFRPDRIILLPLYPQFSTTTTQSSFDAWHKAAQQARLFAPTKTICCYPENTGFITALVEATIAAYDQAKEHGTPRVLFSAHGLPEKIVKAGDPYPSHCEKTAKAIVAEMEKTGQTLDWTLCYQSRVGRLKWIEPYTDEEIIRAGKEKKPLVIVPIAFVSEHSETLVEIDIEYRHLAEQSGVPFFAYVPTVGEALDFIEGLSDMVRASLRDPRAMISGAGGRVCGPDQKGCCMAIK